MLASSVEGMQSEMDPQKKGMNYGRNGDLYSILNP